MTNQVTKEVLLERSRNMRKVSTPSEVMLAKKLKAIGARFKIQYIIHPYIVDFYLPKLKLIIEVDGKSHEERQDYDNRRDKYLVAKGYKIVRISNLRAFQIKHSELRLLTGQKKKAGKMAPNPNSRRSQIKQTAAMLGWND